MSSKRNLDKASRIIVRGGSRSRDGPEPCKALSSFPAQRKKQYGTRSQSWKVTVEVGVFLRVSSCSLTPQDLFSVMDSMARTLHQRQTAWWGNETEDMTILGMVEEKVHWRYEGEHSQRRLEGTRLNTASRTDWAMKKVYVYMWVGEGKRGKEREPRGPRKYVAKMTELYRKENLRDVKRRGLG